MLHTSVYNADPDNQLYGPLNMLGLVYRSVNQSLVDTEKLLKLLNEPSEVNDKPDASDLIVEDGSIEFGESNDSCMYPSYSTHKTCRERHLLLRRSHNCSQWRLVQSSQAFLCCARRRIWVRKVDNLASSL